MSMQYGHSIFFDFFLNSKNYETLIEVPDEATPEVIPGVPDIAETVAARLKRL